MVWGVIALVAGIAYGYLTPGRQDKIQLFWKGAIIGIVLGVLFALLGAVSGYQALGFGGGIGLFFTIVVLTVLFVVGAWIGDFLEAQPRRAPR